MSDSGVTVPSAATHKFVIVLNKSMPPGVALNACAHMAACITGRASDDDRTKMGFVDYVDADGNAHPVSALSLIVLRADNSNQLRTARGRALESGLLNVDFTASMITDTYVEQMARTRELKEADLEYWGLGMFGLKADIDPITKKFSLWRG